MTGREADMRAEIRGLSKAARIAYRAVKSWDEKKGYRRRSQFEEHVDAERYQEDCRVAVLIETERDRLKAKLKRLTR